LSWTKALLRLAHGSILFAEDSYESDVFNFGSSSKLRTHDGVEAVSKRSSIRSEHLGLDWDHRYVHHAGGSQRVPDAYEAPDSKLRVNARRRWYLLRIGPSVLYPAQS